MRNNQRGITLVALVVTIVILIILATVSITMVLGQNGLINRSRQAREMTIQEQENENGIYGQGEDYINSYLTGTLASPNSPVNPREQCVVVYDSNGGSGEMASETGDSVIIKENLFTAPSGASFREWNTKSDGTGDSYTAGQTVTSSVTIYAIWNYPPDTPNLTVASGTLGDNGWYKSDVVVSITGSGSYTEYSVTGAQTVSTEVGNSVTITAEGESTITAYSYDTYGNRSTNPSILVIKKDSVGPTFSGTFSTVTIYTNDSATTVDYRLRNGITVSDATSEVSGDYTYSPTSFTTTGTHTVTYTAIDNAGNVTTQTRTVSCEQAQVCFVAGTKVLTKSGYRNIEDIREGDVLYTMNEETNEIEEDVVIKTHKNPSKVLTMLEFINGEKIVNTPAHPYYVANEGWKETRDLKVGDKILTSTKEEIKIANITTVELPNNISVYNLTMSKNHNYFVGNTKLLVHNVTSGSGWCGLVEIPVD